RSTVLDSKPSSAGDKGVVHVRTVLQNQAGDVLCAFERKALIRAGKLDSRPKDPPGLGRTTPSVQQLEQIPLALRQGRKPALRQGFGACFEDFEVGQIYLHQIGKTVGPSEHMQLTQLFRNTHPLHFDEVYSA